MDYTSCLMVLKINVGEITNNVNRGVAKGGIWRSKPPLAQFFDNVCQNSNKITVGICSSFAPSKFLPWAITGCVPDCYCSLLWYETSESTLLSWNINFLSDTDSISSPFSTASIRRSPCRSSLIHHNRGQHLVHCGLFPLHNALPVLWVSSKLVFTVNVQIGVITHLCRIAFWCRFCLQKYA